MAAVPIPGVNTPTYQSWGSTVAQTSNDRALQLWTRVTAAWTVPVDNAWAVIPFPTPTVNVGSGWQAASNAWRAPRAGWAEVFFTIRPQTLSAATTMNAAVFVGSTEYRVLQSSTSGLIAVTQTGSVPVQVASGDLVTLQININAPSINKTINIGTMFAVRWTD
jgi:hypothetical protein